MITTPYFVAFYNGVEKRPEFELMRLSNAFIHKMDKPELELICKVININFQNNQELLKRSKVLQGYSFFVEQVRVNRRADMPLEKALDAAIDECIRSHILEDFFRDKKEEVKRVMQLDYTWEVREGLIRKEERTEGYNEGERKGRMRDVELIQKNLGLDLPQACAAFGMTIEEYEEMKNLLKQV